MLNLSLVLKALLRDWRSGELGLLTLALIIAVTCISSINIFSAMVQQQLDQQASQMIGGDLVVRSSIPIPSAWEKQAQQLGLQQTKNLSFLSMVEHQQNLQLAQIKAVKAPFPLMGDIKISPSLYGHVESTKTIPQPGTVWLAPRLFPLLKLKVGDIIRIGAADFKVDKVLAQQPNQTGDWFNISPWIMMNWQDITKTQVVQPGSRLTYRWFLTGTTRQLQTAKALLEEKLSPQQKLFDAQSSTPAITKTIQRTIDYLSLGTLMSLVLAGIAISMASQRYSQRHTQQVAILRCFGATEAQVLALYLGSVMVLGLLACLLGTGIGYGMQPLLMQWLGGLLPSFTSHTPLAPAFLSITTGMILLLCFSLGHILRLRKITAVNILRKAQLRLNASAMMSYALGFILVSGLAYLYTSSWTLTFIVMFSCIAVIMLVYLLLFLVFSGLGRVKHYVHLNWRFGIANIARNLSGSALQVIGISLALAAILSLYILRNDLIQDWQQQVPAKAANYFVINIQPDQVNQLKQFLFKQQIESAKIYPIVRGRLMEVNNQPVTAIYGERIKDINALQRELNLSWTTQLPTDNIIKKGSWLDQHSAVDAISIEQGVANRLDVKLGDRLSFKIGGKVVKGVITSIRTVNWGSFNPNFFILFKPGLLNNLPTTYMTSIYLPKKQRNTLNLIVKQFPSATIIDIASLMDKVKMIINNTSHAINFMTYFALLSGLVIVILAMLAFSDAKEHETNVLKLLGMGRLQLLWVQSSESMIIGFLAGLISICIAILLNRYIAESILAINFTTPWQWLFIIPLATSFLTMIVNSLVLRSQYQKRGIR